jgi:pyridoxamine 5'-phosphate oxidase
VRRGSPGPGPAALIRPDTPRIDRRDPRAFNAGMSNHSPAARLLEDDAGDDPIALFSRWFDEAARTCPGRWYEPHCMALATVDADGEPASRIVLLKSFDADGFVFYTNYNSAKARQIATCDRVALTSHWPWLERQVRINGSAGRVDRATSETYFATRPRGSQLGAWVSDQSQMMSVEQMDRRLAELTERFAGQDVPCPPHWGGYVVRPAALEFWQGRADRLHDRLIYRRRDGGWSRRRLGP